VIIAASASWYLSLSSATQRPAGTRGASVSRRAAVPARTFDGPAVDLRWTWHRCWREVRYRGHLRITAEGWRSRESGPGAGFSGGGRFAWSEEPGSLNWLAGRQQNGGSCLWGDRPHTPILLYELQRRDQSLASRGIVPRLYVLDLRERYLLPGWRQALSRATRVEPPRNRFAPPWRRPGRQARRLVSSWRRAAAPISSRHRKGP
jgi:hypothetical protein